MKKLSLKIIAVMLVGCMLFPTVIAGALAGDITGESGNENSVTFVLEKVSETTQNVIVKLVLSEGKALCFDAQIEASDALSCSEIAISDSLKDFFNENMNGTLSVNKDTGRFSVVNTVQISGPIDIAEITYSKSVSAGIKLSDITMRIESCYHTSSDGTDIEADVTVINAIPQTHVHKAAGEWQETVPADCSHVGQKVKYCSECGEVAETQTTDKTNHTVTVDERPATCTEDGYHKEICSVCKEVLKDEVIKAPGHKITVDEKPATCTEDGYYKEICSVCREVLKNDVIKASGHKNTENQHKDATCTEDGYDRVYCNDCNKVISENIIKAQGHKIVIDEKAATCTEDGYYKETCSVCQKVLKDEVIKASGHKIVIDEKSATCTEDGYHKETCSVCQKVLKNEVIKASGHKITVDEKPATCTEDGYHKETCSVCREVLKNEVIKATGHQHKKTDTLAATCTENGYIKEICLDCQTVVKETVLKAAGHKYVKNVKQATCTEDGYIQYQCSVCKLSGDRLVVKSPGHSWGKWRVIKEPTYRSVGIKRMTCTTCGEYVEEELPMIVVPVEKIVIVPEEDFKIYCKKTDRLQATVFPEEAAYSAEIIWTSSDPKIVSVDEDGTITAKIRGTATITASTKDGKVTATRNVTVDYSLLQWIIVYILFGWIWYL